MKPISETTKKKPWLNWVIFLVTVVVVFLIGLFASSIIDRKSEAKMYFQQVHEIAEWEPDNAVWGENFPRQYQSYLETADTNFRSKHGGSGWIDILAHDPYVVLLWAGYAFSRDYAQGRGHYYAVDDVRNSLRTVQYQPATCWTCKSPDVPRMMNKMGVAEFYAASLMDLGPEILNPIGCQDCHDPKTMSLRITRPALAEAFKRQGKDINQATHQEMRSLVCAQCHVEYYFKGEGKYLTFPWDKGLSADSMEAYYLAQNFSDFTHSLSKAPIIKSQHPDYEVYMTGIHADRGVACADCHMPYRRDGSMKFTDHKIQSPLNNIAGSCQVCHRESEETLRRNVYERQDKVNEVKLMAEKSLVLCHIGARYAWENGATEAEMKPVLELITRSQWRWDWVASANGVGFHSPVESLRVLATSIEKSMDARILLAGILSNYNVKLPYAMPDISTKEKAQLYIGLDIAKIKAEKEKFLQETVPQWTKKKGA